MLFYSVRAAQQQSTAASGDDVVPSTGRTKQQVRQTPVSQAQYAQSNDALRFEASGRSENAGSCDVYEEKLPLQAMPLQAKDKPDVDVVLYAGNENGHVGAATGIRRS